MGEIKIQTLILNLDKMYVKKLKEIMSYSNVIQSTILPHKICTYLFYIFQLENLSIFDNKKLFRSKHQSNKT